jgi:hypothetical protein
MVWHVTEETQKYADNKKIETTDEQIGYATFLAVGLVVGACFATQMRVFPTRL